MNRIVSKKKERILFDACVFQLFFKFLNGYPRILPISQGNIKLIFLEQFLILLKSWYIIFTLIWWWQTSVINIDPVSGSLFQMTHYCKFRVFTYTEQIIETVMSEHCGHDCNVSKPLLLEWVLSCVCNYSYLYIVYVNENVLSFRRVFGISALCYSYHQPGL